MGNELMSRIFRGKHPIKHFSLYRLRDSTWRCAVASNYWKTICRAAEYSAIPVSPIRASGFVSASWSCLAESIVARSHGRWRSSNALVKRETARLLELTSFFPVLIYFGLVTFYVRFKDTLKRPLKFSLKANDTISLFTQFIPSLSLSLKADHLNISLFNKIFSLNIILLQLLALFVIRLCAMKMCNELEICINSYVPLPTFQRILNTKYRIKK